MTARVIISITEISFILELILTSPAGSVLRELLLYFKYMSRPVQNQEKKSSGRLSDKGMRLCYNFLFEGYRWIATD